MKDTLRKHYDKLNSQERMSLLMEAMERLDETELTTLVGSDPVKYLVRESWWEMSKIFTIAIHVTMNLTENVLHFVIRTNYSLSRMKDAPEFPDSIDKNFRAKLKAWEDEQRETNLFMEAAERFKVRGKATWNAFKTVCREKGYDPEKVLACAHCEKPILFEYLEKDEDEADKDLESELIKSFRSLWGA